MKHVKVDVRKGEELESKLGKRESWNLNRGNLALKPKFLSTLYHRDLTKGHSCYFQNSAVPPNTGWISVDKQMRIGEGNY